MCVHLQIHTHMVKACKQRQRAETELPGTSSQTEVGDVCSSSKDNTVFGNHWCFVACRQRAHPDVVSYIQACEGPLYKKTR